MSAKVSKLGLNRIISLFPLESLYRFVERLSLSPRYFCGLFLVYGRLIDCISAAFMTKLLCNGEDTTPEFLSWTTECIRIQYLAELRIDCDRGWTQGIKWFYFVIKLLLIKSKFHCDAMWLLAAFSAYVCRCIEPYFPLHVCSVTQKKPRWLYSAVTKR